MYKFLVLKTIHSKKSYSIVFFYYSDLGIATLWKTYSWVTTAWHQLRYTKTRLERGLFTKKQSTQLLHCQLLSHLELHIDSIRMTNMIFQQLGFPPRWAGVFSVARTCTPFNWSYKRKHFPSNKASGLPLVQRLQPNPDSLIWARSVRCDMQRLLLPIWSRLPNAIT